MISDFMKEKCVKIAVVRNRNPIILDNFSQPEPVILICRLPREKYLSRLPAPIDILLIIEVSDSTIYFDRNDKAFAYSNAGIVHYLIVNVENNTIKDYRKPTTDGYQSKQTYETGETFSLIAFPDLEIAVKDFLQS